MNEKAKAIIESYVRAFVVALGVAYSDGFSGKEEILIAALIAIVGPALRALNAKDPAFGLVADAVDVEIEELVKKQAKKKK